MRKKLFTAILFSVTILSLKAQYIFTEDFGQGIPAGWTLIDDDLLVPDPAQTDFVTDAWVAWTDPLDAANTIAVSTSKYLPPGQADDWLITPAITLGSNSILSWYGLAFAAAADGYEVRVSTTTPTLGAFTTVIFSTNAENITWSKHSADLTAFPNQTVYIAFRNNSNDKFVLGIDDIAIFDCNTIGADAGTIDTTNTTACSGFSSLNLGLSPSYLGSTPTNMINGNTNDVPDWSPLVARPFEDDGTCCWIVFGDTSNPPFQKVGFQVTVTGIYTINQTQAGYDGVIYIYTDPFDLTSNPPVTYLRGNDDDLALGSGYSEIDTITLTQGQNYYLVSTGYSTTSAGPYTTTFTGPGSLLLQTPGANELPYDYNFVVSNDNGIIVSIGDDLTNTTLFPGSPGGETYTVCGISYIAANLSLNSFIGQSYSSLVTAVNANPCSALTSDCHTVTILSGGSVDAGVGDTLCAGGTVTLTASGAVSYVWSTGDSTASVQVTPLFTTTYSVTGTDNIGCTASDNVTVKLFASDGGKFKDTGPTLACEGDPALNFSLELEFFKNFFPTQTNLIVGNTLNFFTWAPLPGRPQANGDSCTVCYNPPFDIKPFQVDQTGYYFVHQAQIGYDGYLFLYTDPFDLTQNPPITFISGNDDSVNAGYSYLDSVYLEVGKNYYLISTGFDAGEYGDYITTVRGAGNLMLPGQPDTTDYGFEYLTVNNAGTIIAFSQDLTGYSGSPSGEDYQICAVSYLRYSSSIAPFLGQPFSSLQTAGCLDPSDNCHSVKIFTQPVANAGADAAACFNDTVTLNADIPSAGQGRWTVVSGAGFFLNSANPHSKVYGLAAGVNVLRWTVDIGNGACSDSDTIEIFVQLPVANAGADDTLCRFESATLTASGGVTYSWNSGENTASITVFPAATTVYTITVTDADGCTASDEATVLVNQLPVVVIPNRTICPGSSTVFDAGNPGSSYSWSTGATTQTVTVGTPGATCVTVTDVNGCVNTDCGIIFIGSGLAVTIADTTICDGDSAVLDAGYTGAAYSWSTGDTTQIIKVGEPGVYSVSVVDANNCSGNDSATITGLPLPTASAGIDQSICEGESATLTAIGTGNFQWSTGAASASITVMPAQDSTFTVTVTGGNGCSVSDDVTVVVNALPSFDLGADISLCLGESAILTASAGSQYSWSNGESTAAITINPITTSTYSVTVMTSSNCFANDSISVDVKPVPSANAGNDRAICEGESTLLTATGGGTYFWDIGNTNPSISVSPPASRYYHVTVTAANGCTDDDSVFVEVNAVPVFNLGPDIDYCSGSLLTINASGGGTYSWSNGSTTEYIDVMPANDQTYCATVTSNEGCAATDCVDVTVRPNVVANAGADKTICEGESVTLTATGGTEFEWSSGSTTSSTTVNPVDTRDYSVTVSNAFGCEDVDEVTVNVKDAPEVTLFGFDSLIYCIDATPIIIAGDPTGGTLAGNGVNNGQFSPAAAGVGVHTISYSLTAPNGCTGIDSKDITVDACIGIAGVDGMEIRVYPNPTEHSITVEAEKLSGKDATITLLNALGQIVLNDKMEYGKMMIDLSEYAAGVYQLQINYAEGSSMKRIIKN